MERNSKVLQQVELEYGEKEQGTATGRARACRKTAKRSYSKGLQHVELEHAEKQQRGATARDCNR
jgi:hypothetical protein